METKQNKNKLGFNEYVLQHIFNKVFWDIETMMV